MFLYNLINLLILNKLHLKLFIWEQVFVLSLFNFLRRISYRKRLYLYWRDFLLPSWTIAWISLLEFGYDFFCFEMPADLVIQSVTWKAFVFYTICFLAGFNNFKFQVILNNFFQMISWVFNQDFLYLKWLFFLLFSICNLLLYFQIGNMHLKFFYC